jgi:hypothetical protein
MNRCGLVSASMLVLATACATSALAASALAQPTVVVHGDATCPSEDMIQSALRTTRPHGEWPEQPVIVEVSDDGLALLLGESPAVRREIPADADCAVRAESAAVVIAAWSGELASRPTDSAVLTVPSPAPMPVPATTSHHVLDVDAAAFYSVLWGHAPGAWLGVGRVPRNSGVGVRALGAYQASRDITLEGGTNQLLRLLLGAAVTYQLQRTRVFASGDVGLIGTLTRARGAGYESNQVGSTTNFGGFAELRGGLRLGRARLWLDTRLLRLARAETVKIRSTSPGVADSARLSAWDLQIGLGFGLCFD